jgi:dihydropteroate synthase
MQAALDAGADIVNDVKALQRPGALEVVARSPNCGVCLMHMRGEPETMQSMIDYDDVVADVRRFFVDRLLAAEEAGIADERIVLDPGIGFAKTSEHNWLLLHRQSELVALGRPILVGWSRKSALGKVTGRDVHHRLGASVTAALACVQRGASIVRVHDVADTVDAIKIWQAAKLLPPMSAE